MKGKESIFESSAQWMDHLDPASIGLISDRCLLKDVQDEAKIGSIWIPDMARDKSKIRKAIVVAIGPGDNSKEWISSQHTVDSDGKPLLIRRQVNRCRCGHQRNHHLTAMPKGIEVSGPVKYWVVAHDCLNDGCDCNKFEARLPMPVQAGQTVLTDRRREAEIYINGDRFYLVHAEQAIIAILEE